MPLTPEDVANTQFTSTRLKPGYDETEVDEFLDEVEAELTRLYRENDELRSKVAAAGRGAPEGAAVAAAAGPAAVDPNPALARENEELRQKLAATQRQLAEAANRPAAQAPPAQAAPQAAPAQAAPSETATGILALAQRTADEHIAEARTQADRIIGERSTLEREVEKLRSFEREYRSRLKNYLEGQLRELDGSSTSAPAVQGGGGQGQPPQGQQAPQGQPTGQGAPARSPFAPGAPVGGDTPSGPPQQPQGFGDGDQRG
jgi:DivIVA domain-containing protein